VLAKIRWRVHTFPGPNRPLPCADQRRRHSWGVCCSTSLFVSIVADRYFAAVDARRRAGRDRFPAELAHGAVVELPGAGHFVFLTQPERVEREMRALLAHTP